MCKMHGRADLPSVRRNRALPPAVESVGTRLLWHSRYEEHATDADRFHEAWRRRPRRPARCGGASLRPAGGGPDGRGGPGGLRRDLLPKGWLPDALEEIRQEAARYAQLLSDTDSYLDRLITTGPLPRKVAFDQGATGPVERASGIDRDLRRDYPYAAYADLPLTVPVETAGDAHARFKVRAAEIDASFVLMQRTLLLLPEGEVDTECRPAPGTHGLGWAESPRGTLFYAVHVGPDGRLERVKIKSPSFSNWRVFPFTVHDSNMMDYAINEASFGLTIAGCDR